MARAIRTRVLSVSFLGDREGQEALEYRLEAAGEDSPPPHRYPIPEMALSGRKDQFISCLEELVDKACRGEHRGHMDLEAAADRLAADVLPPEGLAGVVPLGFHPMLDISQPWVADIPWEAFAERFAFCVNGTCPARGVAFAHDPEQPAAGFCPHCLKPRQIVNGRMVFTRYVGHLVRGTPASPPPAGNEFLIIADPTEELCGDSHQSQKVCRQHLSSIFELAKGAGLKLTLLAGRNATVARVREALAKPTLAGIYYFGHGDVEGGVEGSLVLAGREPLLARDITRAHPSARMVFLNACYGAKGGKEWLSARRFRSVSEAFATSTKGAVVVAPICRVSSVHAAPMAVRFFTQAFRGCRFSKAMRFARHGSFRAYRAGQADVCWAVYRYFGDPARAFPAPGTTSESSRTTVAVGAPQSRVFEKDGRLDADAFSLPLEEVLLRAAKRRNLQSRWLVAPRDLLAGLLRRGELTRLACLEHGKNPDGLYEACFQVAEAEPEPKQKPKSGLLPKAAEPEPEQDRWTIDHRREFSDSAADLLCAADALARSRASAGEVSPVTERDLLMAMLDRGVWAAAGPMDLPPAANIRAWLANPARAARTDADGRIPLGDLDAAARRVVEVAHGVSQQRGAYPIPNRLVFAAFLLDENGCAAKLCKKWKRDPELLCAVMLAMTESESPQTFTLGFPAARRALVPMLARARQVKGQEGLITEEALFHAFCESAPEDFKKLVKSLPEGMAVDLEKLWEEPEEDSSGASKPDAPKPDKPAPETAGPEAKESSDPVDLPESGDREESARPDPSEDEAPSPSDAQENVEPVDQEETPPDRDESDELGGAKPGESESQLDLARLNDAARELLTIAAGWARVQGSVAIRQPHLFAALVHDGNTATGGLLRRHGLDPEKVKIAVLSIVPSQSLDPKNPPDRVALSGTCFNILQQSVEIAQSQGREAANCDDILWAFFADGGGKVGELLRGMGVSELAIKPRREPGSGRMFSN